MNTRTKTLIGLSTLLGCGVLLAQSTQPSPTGQLVGIVPGTVIYDGTPSASDQFHLSARAVLAAERSAAALMMLAGPPCVLVDDSQPNCVTTGTWTSSTSTPGYIGTDYLTIPSGSIGTATYTPLLAYGPCQVFIHVIPGTNRATNVLVNITPAMGSPTTTVSVNEQLPTAWVYLGSFTLDATAKVVVTTTGANGYVIADAVEFIPGK